MLKLSALPILLVVLLAAGCAGTAVVSPSPPAPSLNPPGTPAPSATPVPSTTPGSSPVLTIETRGGECPSGPCGSLVKVEGDGTLHQLVPTDKVIGTISPELLEALRIEVDQANYALLQSRPFRGECPTAFDGQETIYTFHVSTGDEVIASCQVAIDENHPLFRAVAAVLAAGGI